MLSGSDDTIYQFFSDAQVILWLEQAIQFGCS